MLSNSHRYVLPDNEAEWRSLEALIGEDFARCHPGETLEDIRRRAAFSKEDRGLLRDWVAVVARARRGQQPARKIYRSV
jgi:hypothetical protein